MLHTIDSSQAASRSSSSSSHSFVACLRISLQNEYRLHDFVGLALVNADRRCKGMSDMLGTKVPGVR